MHRIQVIGLPGAGKSTGIKRFLSKFPELNIEYFDISKYKERKEAALTAAVSRAVSPNIIIESACGIYLPNSTIIKLEPPIQIVYKQYLARDSELDEDYMSLLSSIMCTSGNIVRNTQELVAVLTKIFIEPDSRSK